MAREIFQGVKALIVCGFCGFSKASATIIHKNINQAGGEAEILLGKSTRIDTYTHIIAPAGADEGKLADVLAVTRDQLDSLLILSQDWAVDSVRFHHIADLDKYRWKSIRPAPLPASAPYKKAKIESGEQTPPRDSVSQTVLSGSPAKSGSGKLLHSDSENEFEVEEGKPTESFEELLERVKTKKGENRFVPKREMMQTSVKTQEYWEKQKHKFHFAKEVQDTNLNEHITSVLEKLMNNYQLLKDKGRYFAYRDAVTRLKAHPEHIHCAEQVRGLERFGDKMVKKISEILETGTVRRVQAMDEMQYLKSMKELCSVWGIGTATADKLYKSGYRTIADLKARPSPLLNASQVIGLEFYDEFAEKMNREEVKAICDKVEEAARSKAGSRQLIVVPCGSYRRGRVLCGDADVLMAFNDMLPFDGFLTEIVDFLFASGLITHRLQISDHYEPSKKHSHEMFAGVAQLPGGKHRRLDIKIYPRKVFAWALLHFTGSANFNRSIRLFAKKKGFKLTDEGFFTAIRDGAETYHGENTMVCYTEEDIFRLFGIEYKTPEQRDI